MGVGRIIGSGVLGVGGLGVVSTGGAYLGSPTLESSITEGGYEIINDELFGKADEKNWETHLIDTDALNGQDNPKEKTKLKKFLGEDTDENNALQRHKEKCRGYLDRKAWFSWNVGQEEKELVRRYCTKPRKFADEIGKLEKTIFEITETGTSDGKKWTLEWKDNSSKPTSENLSEEEKAKIEEVIKEKLENVEEKEQSKNILKTFCHYGKDWHRNKAEEEGLFELFKERCTQDKKITV